MTTGADGERIAAAAAVGLHLEVAGTAAESVAAAIAVGLHLEGMGAVAAAVGLALGGGLAPHVPAVDWWKTAGRLDALGGRAAVRYGRRTRAGTVTR